MLPEAADKIRNRREMKFKRNIRYRSICISKQPFSFIYHFILNVLLCTKPHCRSYDFIQVIGSDAKFFRIKPNRMLILQMSSNQMDESVYMSIIDFFICGDFLV